MASFKSKHSLGDVLWWLTSTTVEEGKLVGITFYSETEIQYMVRTHGGGVTIKDCKWFYDNKDLAEKHLKGLSLPLPNPIKSATPFKRASIL